MEGRGGAGGFFVCLYGWPLRTFTIQRHETPSFFFYDFETTLWWVGPRLVPYILSPKLAGRKERWCWVFVRSLDTVVCLLLLGLVTFLCLRGAWAGGWQLVCRQRIGEGWSGVVGCRMKDAGRMEGRMEGRKTCSPGGTTQSIHFTAALWNGFEFRLLGGVLSSPLLWNRLTPKLIYIPQRMRPKRFNC